MALVLFLVLCDRQLFACWVTALLSLAINLIIVSATVCMRAVVTRLINRWRVKLRYVNDGAMRGPTISVRPVALP